jgi:hypothetical protein
VSSSKRQHCCISNEEFNKNEQILSALQGVPILVMISKKEATEYCNFGHMLSIEGREHMAIDIDRRGLVGDRQSLLMVVC